MAYEQETAAAMRILEGIEGGLMSTSDLTSLVEDADPALLYLIVTWLRNNYGPSNDASDAVLGRLGEVCNRPAVAKLIKEGQTDSVVAWFEDAYSYRKLAKEEFLELVIDKLES